MHICSNHCTDPGCIKRQRDEYRESYEEASRPLADAGMPLSDIAIAALFNKHDSAIEFARRIEEAHGINPHHSDALKFAMA